MAPRPMLLLVVALVLACAFPAAAEVRRTIRIDSVPPGAQVFLTVAGDRTPIGTTPLDYAAEFHSEMSVLRIRVEHAGFAGTDLELTAAKDRVVATLSAAAVVASAAAQPDAGLKGLQDRIATSSSGAIRQALAAKSAAGIQADGAAVLRKIDGVVYLEVPLTLPAPPTAAMPGEPARRLWHDIGGELLQRVGQSLPPSSGIAGVVVVGRIESTGAGFSVSSRAESKTEIQCIPGMRQMFDSCATQVPTYETTCYNGQCSQRNTGTRCAGGMKAVYDACATMGPVTKFSVTVDPHATVGNRGARVIVVADFGAKGTPAALAQFDDAGKPVFREGKLPAALDAK